MTKKILSAILAVMLVLSLAAFTVSADEENAVWVEAGATGDGTEDDPLGTIEDAILALGGKDGTIYVYGAYNMTGFKAPEWKGMVTITGVNSDSILSLEKGKDVVFKGDVTLKDILVDIAANAHFNGYGKKMIVDFGEDANFGYMFHLPAIGNTVVEESYTEFLSGTIATVYIGGGYTTSYANGVMGDCTLILDGATIKSLRLSADAFKADHTGISVGGNMNIVINSGEVTQISTKSNNDTPPEIMGALNIIFNNGNTPPKTFAYPEETVSGGVYIVYSEEGGKIMPTSEVGVFEVISDSKDLVAQIDGELVYNGTVELEPGETTVEWVAGEQPEVEEKIEIKLTIGKAEITTNGEAKELDVPAQIIDSRTMVPLRAIFEALGASVEWDDATKTVTSVKEDTTVKLTIGDKNLHVNDTVKELDVPAQIVDSRTLVPVRAIAESFGCEVAWDDATKTVTITK